MMQPHYRCKNMHFSHRCLTGIVLDDVVAVTVQSDRSGASGKALVSDEEEEVLRVADMLDKLHVPEDNESKLDQVSANAC